MSKHTRGHILDAAERLLARLGYEKTTIDDLAREAGNGTTTIYAHFTGKEDVALSTIDRTAERLKVLLRSIAIWGKRPAVRVRRMLQTRILVRFDSVRDYDQSIDDLFQAIRPGYLARRARHFAEESHIFAEVLTEGRVAGEFAFENPFTAAQMLLLATDSLLPSSMSAREVGERRELEAKASEIVELLLTGVLACRATEPVRKRSQAPRRKVVTKS